jgi:hypothetical protein
MKIWNALALVMVLGILLVGCIQLNDKNPAANNSNFSTHPANNSSLPINTTVNNGSGHIGANNTPAANNSTAPIKPVYNFKNYDASVTSLNVEGTPVLSQISRVDATVEVAGNARPSAIVATLSDNGEIVDTKEIQNPSERESVQFSWMVYSEGTHTLKVECAGKDPAIAEDGTLSNNAKSGDYDAIPIGAFDAASAKDLSESTAYAQQFTVANKIGIGSLAVYLTAEKGAPQDVQIIIELRRDNLNTPGQVIVTRQLDARRITSDGWYPVTYGRNGYYLEPGKYWISIYLAEASSPAPQWGIISGNAGATAHSPTTRIPPISWSQDSGYGYAFKVMSEP